MNLYSLDEGSISSPSSSVSQMSVGSEPSPTPSPFSPSPPPHSPHSTFRYKNIYEERLEPLYSSRTESTTLYNRPLPKSTHQSEFDVRLQARFSQLVEERNYTELETLLQSSSHAINLNQFDQAGQTPLQRFCLSGDLSLVQLMVRYGADTQLASRDGWTTLHYASYSGVQEVLLYVLRCCPRR